MKEQDVSSLLPGMRLADDIKGTSGTIILKKGTVLNRGIISGLVRRGVRSVMVETEDESSAQDMNTNELKDKVLEQLEILRPIFSRSSDLEWMAILMKAAATARARRS